MKNKKIALLNYMFTKLENELNLNAIHYLIQSHYPLTIRDRNQR